MGNSPQELQDRAIEAMKQRFLERDYAAFLTRTGDARGPKSAALFAIGARGGMGYADKSEREIIIALVGELPPFFD